MQRNTEVGLFAKPSALDRFSAINAPEKPSRVAVWILGARPKTLWAAVAPVLIGTAMAYDSGGGAWLFALVALFGAIMIQIGTNLANDYFDCKKGADAQDRLGPMRVTTAGLVTPESMKLAVAIAFSLAGAAGIYLTWHAGWPIAVIGVLSILSGIFYTAGPYPLGYIGLGDIFVLIFFGPVAVGGTYFVQALDITWTVVLAGLAPGLFSVAILTVNNLRDVEADTKAGKRTLAVRFGKAFARLEYLLSILVASSIPVIFYVQTAENFFALCTMAVPLIAIPSIRKVFTYQHGAVLNDVLAATGKLLLLYSVLFSIGWLM